MKKHSIIPPMITALARGFPFLSYPLRDVDGDQSAEQYLICELASGGFLSATGSVECYPFFITSVTAFAASSGRSRIV
jgi:hypothetical protein